jgi:hypothetical protein
MPCHGRRVNNRHFKLHVYKPSKVDDAMIGVKSWCQG